MDDGFRKLAHPFAAGWFVAGLYLFAIGVAVSTGTIALAVLPQMKALGAITLLCAIFGALVCGIGIRLYHPSRWRGLQSQLSSLGDSLRGASDAIGEPRSVAYARAHPPLGATRHGAWPQGGPAD